MNGASKTRGGAPRNAPAPDEGESTGELRELTFIERRPSYGFPPRIRYFLVHVRNGQVVRRELSRQDIRAMRVEKQRVIRNLIRAIYRSERGAWVTPEVAAQVLRRTHSRCRPCATYVARAQRHGAPVYLEPSPETLEIHAFSGPFVLRGPHTETAELEPKDEDEPTDGWADEEEDGGVSAEVHTP